MRRACPLIKAALLLIVLMLFTGQALAGSVEQGPASSSRGVMAFGDVDALAGTFPRCLSGCTAGDIRVDRFWLETNSTCTPGEPTAATLHVVITYQRQNTYCVRVVGDVQINSDPVQADQSWLLTSYNAGSGTIDYAVTTINWTCGQEMKISNILLQYAPNSGDCNSCAAYQPGSKCAYDAGPKLVEAPLVADFSADTVCEGTATTFSDKTTGGKSPYTYSWDFGDGSSPSTAPNPAHTYAQAGSYNVTLSVTDSSTPPKTDSQTRTVTVVECCTLESVSVGGNLEYDPEICGSRATLVATVAGGKGPFTYQWYNGNQPIGTTNPLQLVLEPGNYNISVVVTDTAFSDCAVTSAVVPLISYDVYPPDVFCPADIVLESTANDCTAVVGFVANAEDNCQVAGIEYSVDGVPIDNSLHAFSVGETAVTVVATDIYGMANQCAFKVTVLDKQAPELTCPADIVTSPEAGQCDAAVTFGATARDNCGIESVEYYVGETKISSPHVFPVGTTKVSVVATDIHGKQSNCQFTVTVNDTQAPSITCPADIVQDTDRGLCSATVELGDPTVDDNCGVDYITSWRSDGLALNAAYPVGVTTITRQVTDKAGNQATCTQKVTIEDRSPTVLKIEKSGPAVAADGDTVIYTFAVSHDRVNGDGAPVSQVTVLDDLAGPATYVSGNDNDSLLEMGETWIFRAAYTVREVDPAVLVNTAIVTGYDCDGDMVIDRDSHTLKVARARLGQPQDWHDPHCAGWRQRYTVVYTNTGAVPLTGVILAAEIPGEAVFDAPSSSAGLIVDDATHAHWEAGVVQPGQVVKLYLEIRAFTTMANKTLKTCFTLDADLIDPQTLCEQSAVIRCDGPTPTLEPTKVSTVTPTKTATPKPALTPSPTPTTSLPTEPMPNDGKHIWLPIIDIRFAH